MPPATMRPFAPITTQTWTARPGTSSITRPTVTNRRRVQRLRSVATPDRNVFKTSEQLEREREYEKQLQYWRRQQSKLSPLFDNIGA